MLLQHEHLLIPNVQWFVNKLKNAMSSENFHKYLIQYNDK